MGGSSTHPHKLEEGKRGGGMTRQAGATIWLCVCCASVRGLIPLCMSTSRPIQRLCG